MMLISLLTLSSCDRTIHEYPAHLEIALTLHCSIDNVALKPYVTVECNAEEGMSYVAASEEKSPESRSSNEELCLRYIIDLYHITASHSELVERKTIYAELDDNDTEVTARFEADATLYKVLVWCDYVDGNSRESWYYNTENLHKITYTEATDGDNDHKEAYTGVLSIDLSDYYYADGIFDFEYDLILERALGRMRCTTTDRADFEKGGTSIDDIVVQVTYSQYISAGYDVEEQRPNYFEPTRSFISKPIINKSGELELCHDYILVGNKETNIKVDYRFFDREVADNREISHWSGIVVPLRRGMESTVTGRLLTTSFGSDGIGINPDFDDEIIVEWKE